MARVFGEEVPRPGFFLSPIHMRSSRMRSDGHRSLDQKRPRREVEILA